MEWEDSPERAAAIEQAERDEYEAAQPHPETPQGDGYSMDEAEKARWASFRTGTR